MAEITFCFEAVKPFTKGESCIWNIKFSHFNVRGKCTIVREMSGRSQGILICCGNPVIDMTRNQRANMIMLRITYLVPFSVGLTSPCVFIFRVIKHNDVVFWQLIKCFFINQVLLERNGNLFVFYSLRITFEYDNIYQNMQEKKKNKCI